ncbi:hypothetical protein Hanom_Chr01g00054941 [Helianthus anomalus]
MQFHERQMDFRAFSVIQYETAHMLLIWKLQSIINQLKIFSKTMNTLPLLSRMYSLLCSI